MSINKTIVRTWLAKCHMANGQIIEHEVRAKTIKEVREKLKEDKLIKRIMAIKKA